MRTLVCARVCWASQNRKGVCQQQRREREEEEEEEEGEEVNTPMGEKGTA